MSVLGTLFGSSSHDGEDEVMLTLDPDTGKILYNGGEGCRQNGHGNRLCKTVDDLLAYHPSFREGYERGRNAR